MAKEIKVIELEVGELKFGFQNPRKVTTQKLEELEASLNNLGDFGIFVIDEEKNVIGGNQRAKTLQKKDPHIMVTCKMLIGYTDEEKRAIAIMDNEHAGTWELEGLAAWTADLNLAPGHQHRQEARPRPARSRWYGPDPLREIRLCDYRLSLRG